jgi:hypothetical protein
LLGASEAQQSLFVSSILLHLPEAQQSLFVSSFTGLLHFPEAQQSLFVSSFTSMFLPQVPPEQRWLVSSVILCQPQASIQ